MNAIQTISVLALPLIFAITIHEAAHGWTAWKLGDPTAKDQGRLTFNPIPHIDPIGTILLPMAMFILVGFLFGWAKPVPVNPNHFKEPRKDMALVAIAGPGSNLIMAIVWAMLWKVATILPESAAWLTVPLTAMGQAGVFLNLILMVLNLLPLPPLDGGRILTWVLPPNLADKADQIEPYGIFILIGLLYFGLWQVLISPAVSFFSTLIQTMVLL